VRSLAELRHNWDGFARTDPFWSILSDSNTRDRQWDETAFFESGAEDVSRLLAHCQIIRLPIDLSAPALDFGCGVGRLTQALASHFAPCTGVDISPVMIELANQYNRFPDTCRYVVNNASVLAEHPNNHFGFICCLLVLQHMKTELADSYLREMIRVLRPGGVLVSQILDPADLALSPRLRARLQLRTHLRALGSRLHLGPKPYRLGIHGMYEERVRAEIIRAGGQTVDVEDRARGDKYYYVTK
jgi:ubiquinone/menaquinone biosynthesis C-methylase UbiE